jgi:hypothetical protein
MDGGSPEYERFVDNVDRLAHGDMADVFSAADVIAEPISNIDDALERIVGDAKATVLGLDWAHFDITPESVEQDYDTLYPISLRNAPYDLPLSVVVDEPGPEGDFLQSVAPQRVRNLAANYYLVLLSERISPHMATFTRDHLMISMPELIARMGRVSEVDVLAHFGSDPDSPLPRASVRMHAVLQANPEILREN